MKISIPLEELQAIIAKKTNKQIALARSNENSLRCILPYDIPLPLFGPIHKEASMELTIKRIEGLDVVMDCSFVKGADKLPNKIKSILFKQVEHLQYVSCCIDKSELVIHLDKIAERKGINNLSQYAKFITNPVILITTDAVILNFELQL